MIPASFDYHRPASLDEALKLLKKHGDDAKVLSGGMSLLPMMKLRLASVAHLVDIGRIPGLDLGARTPEEIALSIMAQIVERRRASARPPREKPCPQPAREAVDPICGMSVTVAGARHTVEAGGTTWYFCCAGCRAKFLADPQRHARAI